MHAIDFKEIQEKLADGFLPWQRSFQFWARTSDIYTGYKVSLFRYSFLLLLWSFSFLRIPADLRLCLCLLLCFLRYFSFEWASSRMWRSRRKCGRDNMNLPPTKFTLCALTLVVSSLRYSNFLNWFLVSWPIRHFFLLGVCYCYSNLDFLASSFTVSVLPFILSKACDNQSSTLGLLWFAHLCFLAELDCSKFLMTFYFFFIVFNRLHKF